MNMASLLAPRGNHMVDAVIPTPGTLALSTSPEFEFLGFGFLISFQNLPSLYKLDAVDPTRERWREERWKEERWRIQEDHHT